MSNVANEEVTGVVVEVTCTCGCEECMQKVVPLGVFARVLVQAMQRDHAMTMKYFAEATEATRAHAATGAPGEEPNVGRRYPANLDHRARVVWAHVAAKHGVALKIDMSADEILGWHEHVHATARHFDHAAVDVSFDMADVAQTLAKAYGRHS